MDSDSDSAPEEVSKEVGKQNFLEQRKNENEARKQTKKKTKRRKRARASEVEENTEASEKEPTLANELLATVAKLKKRQEELRKEEAEKVKKKKSKKNKQIIIGGRAKQTGFIPSARNDNIQIAYYDEHENDYVYGEVAEDPEEYSDDEEPAQMDMDEVAEGEEDEEEDEEWGKGQTLGWGKRKDLTSKTKKIKSDFDEPAITEKTEAEKKIDNECEDEYEASANNFLDNFLNGGRIKRVSYEEVAQSRNHRRNKAINAKYRPVYS